VLLSPVHTRVYIFLVDVVRAMSETSLNGFGRGGACLLWLVHEWRMLVRSNSRVV
jgi:hypothetical protein